MSKIKTKDNEKSIKLFDRTADITHNMKAGYTKAKRKIEKQIEDNNGNAYEYADETLDDIVEDTSSSAEAFAKKNFKKSVQKQRTIKSEQRFNERMPLEVNMNKHATVIPVNNNGQKAIYEKAKDRAIKNSIKAKLTGATTIKEKVVEFIKGGYAATINTAKIAIVNTKALWATLLGVGSVGTFFIIIICIIGLVMGSSFGIFMATEDTGTGYTLNTVMQEINDEYFAEIERIKTEIPHDDFEISDRTPNWKDILAIYAVKITTAHEGAEVVTVDEEKVELIREVFWDMIEIVYETESYEDTITVETTDEQGNMIEQEITMIKTRLVIDIKNKTADEAAALYGFNGSKLLLLKELENEDNLNLWNSITETI